MLPNKEKKKSLVKLLHLLETDYLHIIQIDNARNI